MSITVGTNSWISRADADSYFSTRYGASAWASLSNSDKESLLITTFYWIKDQDGLSVPDSASSAKVKRGQCEAAWFWYNHHEGYEERVGLYASGVRDFQVSRFEEELEAPQFPDFLKKFFEDYIVNSGGFFPTMSRELNQGTNG